MEGRALLAHALDCLLGHPQVGRIEVLRPMSVDGGRVRAALGHGAAIVPVGPATVGHLRTLISQHQARYPVLLVHDALTPLAAPALVDDLAAAVEPSGLALPLRPVADALKSLRASNGAALVCGAVDRSEHRLLAAPHAYSATVAEAALDRLSGTGAVLSVVGLLAAALALGAPPEVRTVPAPDSAFTVTCETDVAVAAALLAQQRRAG